jgi:hypothetical protein
MITRVVLWVAVVLALAGAVPGSAKAESWDDRPDPDEYEESLGPYGYWVDDAQFGRVWRPHMHWEWRPYVDGQWTWTSYGWTWASDYPWGWTHHYGRWGFSASFGWVWTPGYVWGPAWVDWYWGDGYVGWAPLGPVGFAVVPSYWTYVHDYSFCAPRIHNVIVVHNHLPRHIFHHRDHGWGRRRAPDFRDIEHVSRHRIVREHDRRDGSVAPWVKHRLERGERVRERINDRGRERVVEHAGRRGSDRADRRLERDDGHRGDRQLERDDRHRGDRRVERDDGLRGDRRVERDDGWRRRDHDRDDRRPTVIEGNRRRNNRDDDRPTLQGRSRLEDDAPRMRRDDAPRGRRGDADTHGSVEPRRRVDDGGMAPRRNDDGGAWRRPRGGGSESRPMAGPRAERSMPSPGNGGGRGGASIEHGPGGDRPNAGGNGGSRGGDRAHGGGGGSSRGGNHHGRGGGDRGGGAAQSMH